MSKEDLISFTWNIPLLDVFGQSGCFIEPMIKYAMVPAISDFG